LPLPHDLVSAATFAAHKSQGAVVTDNTFSLDDIVDGSEAQRFGAADSLLVIWHGGIHFHVWERVGADRWQEVDRFAHYGDLMTGTPTTDPDEAIAAMDTYFKHLAECRFQDGPQGSGRSGGA
jgi:hypothetical protein